MREDRVQDHEVRDAVLDRKPEFLGSHPARGVVHLVLQVHVHEAEMVVGREDSLTELHALAHGFDPDVPHPFGGQRDRIQTVARADVDDEIARLPGTEAIE